MYIWFSTKLSTQKFICAYLQNKISRF